MLNQKTKKTMNTLMRRNGDLFPSVFSDFFSTRPLLGANFFDVDFDLLPARLGVNVPLANVTESDKDYLISLAVPGMKREDFKVEMEKDQLSISAEKKEEKKESDKEYTRQEYSYESFCRKFTLPENAKADKINAKYENGVLNVTVPKKEVTPVKAKKEIAVA
jgi:HSP20 family protein